MLHVQFGLSGVFYVYSAVKQFCLFLSKSESVNPVQSLANNLPHTVICKSAAMNISSHQILNRNLYKKILENVVKHFDYLSVPHLYGIDMFIDIFNFQRLSRLFELF